MPHQSGCGHLIMLSSGEGWRVEGLVMVNDGSEMETMVSVYKSSDEDHLDPPEGKVFV